LATLDLTNASVTHAFCFARAGIFYGAAHFGNFFVALFFVLLAASMPPRRRVALPTALLATRPRVRRLTGSGPQREFARADDERIRP